MPGSTPAALPRTVGGELRARPAPAFLMCCAAVAGLALAGCERGGSEAAVLPNAELAELSAPELDARLCQGCHLLPDPALLPRDTWRDDVLPRMAQRFGIYARPGLREDSLIEAGPGGVYVLHANVFPESPQIPEAAWRRLVAYYLARAPERLPPQPARPAVRMGLPRFRVRIPEFRARPPLTSLVAIDPAGGRIFLGDTKQDFSTLEILDGSGQPIQSLGMESAPVQARISGDSVDVLLMGKLLPTDDPAGLLRTVFRQPGAREYSGAIRRVDGLFRPVHVSYGDLNSDGLEDLVVSEFGNLTGRLAWYERKLNGEYDLHVLRPSPGAVATHVRDVDGDGDLDVIALMAQGDEGVYLYRNAGAESFREERLLRFHPSYGSTAMEVVDFDRDGDFDLVHASGDNGDYRPVPKPYHGIRVFLNDGKNAFEEAHFFPLYGAFGLRARDFDRDGDLDIAAIAFYPEYHRPPAESFVYLENRGSMEFTAATFPETNQGRWLTLDSGDLDGDGDDDIVLGSFVAFDPIGDPSGLHQRWLQEGPSLVILENATR